MRVGRQRAVKAAAAALAGLLLCGAAFAARIKDIAEVYGPMENPLVGTGLVVGLSGTGDDAKFAPAIKQLANMLSNLGAEALPAEVAYSKNVAVVTVWATLPKFNKVGDRLTVEVSGVGNAQSLEGGRLALCPLMAPGPDGRMAVYAIAQGTLSVDPQWPCNAVIEDAAIVQRAVPTDFLPGNRVTFKLRNEYADYSIAANIVKAIHADLNIDTLKGDSAVAFAVDARTVEVRLSEEQMADPVGFISQLEWLGVPGLSRDLEARVVIDERRGLFYAIAGNVEVSPAFARHGNLEVAIKADEDQGTTLEDLVKGLRDLEASPEDVVGILKELEALGALHAKVIRK